MEATDIPVVGIFCCCTNVDWGGGGSLQHWDQERITTGVRRCGHGPRAPTRHVPGPQLAGRARPIPPPADTLSRGLKDLLCPVSADHRGRGPERPRDPFGTADAPRRDGPASGRASRWSPSPSPRPSPSPSPSPGTLASAAAPGVRPVCVGFPLPTSRWETINPNQFYHSSGGLRKHFVY